MCGLPASGKTTTAERIHASAGGVLIRSCDVYRSLGISLPDWVRRTEGFTRSLEAYERERDRAYVEMAHRLEQALASRAPLVIVDAVHGEWAKRQVVYRVCETLEAMPILVWCQGASCETIQRRFELRRGQEEQADPRNEASDFSVFRHIAGLWEDPMADPVSVPTVVYDTWRDELRPLRGPSDHAEEILRSALAMAPGVSSSR